MPKSKGLLDMTEEEALAMYRRLPRTSIFRREYTPEDFVRAQTLFKVEFKNMKETTDEDQCE